MVPPDEEPIATVAQAVARYPVVVGAVLQQYPRRVGGVAPEAAGVADAMLGPVVRHLVVAGLQQVNPHVATMRRIVPRDQVVIRPDQADAVEVIAGLIVLDGAVPNLSEIDAAAEPFFDRTRDVGQPTGIQGIGVVRHDTAPDVEVAHVVGVDPVVETADHAVDDGNLLAIVDPKPPPRRSVRRPAPRPRGPASRRRRRFR